MLNHSRGRLRGSKILAHAVIEHIESRMLLSAVVASPSLAPVIFSPVQPIKLGSSPAGTKTEPQTGGLTPNNVRGAYGLGPVTSPAISFSGLNGVVQGNGTNQTIALVDAYNDPDIQTDLATFDSYFGIPAPPSFTVVGQSGSTTSLPGNSAISGSNDWSGEESLDVEWSHAMAPNASIVLVECTSPSTYLEQGDQVAASITGVSVVSNSYGGGESSNESTALDPYFTTPSNHVGVSFFASTGDTGASVEYPAQSPNVVAVGGTQLSVSGSTYSSETAWVDSGGGTSAYEAQPSYQAGTITATKRETPDISILGGQNSGSSNCYAPIVDSWDTVGTAGPWEGVVGTSWSSPVIAALVAIANQGRAAEGLGNLTTVTGSNQVDTRLYQLAANNFHDITTGSNGHNAVVGYDEASGIGTPVANLLIPDLAGAATVTGQAFVDNAGNGVYGGTDTPIAGQTVYLDLNNDGKLDNSEPSATTNAQGFYTFTDVPAGGIIRLTSSAPTGYTLTSPSTASITYGATDTVNFTFQATPTQVAFSQQPAASTGAGTTLSPVIVNVENTSGATVGSDSSTVTLTLSQGTFSTGSNTATAAASGGVATFSSLAINSDGTYTLTATDGSLTSAVSSSFQITVTKTTPTVTWTSPASITYGTALSSTQLDATASVAGTFVYSPASGTVLGAGASQTLNVTFTPTDTTDYTTATGSTTLTVTQATPTITWTQPGSITYGTALSSTQLDATSSTSGSFVYSPAAGTVLGAGPAQNLSVTFTPADSVDYTNASGYTTLTVLKATPSVSWTAPASITYGTLLSSTQLDATASTPGTFVYTPAAGTLLGAGSGQSLGVAFTPTDTTDYTSASGSTSITVLKATPVITWATPASIAYPTPLSSTQMDASTSVAGSFVYTPAAGTVLSPGANQSLSAAFTPTDSTDYTTASASVSITVTGVVTSPLNLTGSAFYLKLDNASPQNLDIWTNSTAAGTPADVVEFDTISSATFSANAAGDSFTADFSNGSVQPSGGLTFNGFGSASANTLTVVGTGGSDTVTVPGTGSFNLNALTVGYSQASIGNVYFAPGGAGETLTVPSTSVTLAPGTGSGITADIFNSISVSAGAQLLVPAAASHSTRLLVQTNTLSLSPTGTLDLSNNDLVLTSGTALAVSAWVNQGISTGTTGIISSAAINDPTYLTTLGVIQNSADGTTGGTPLYGSSAPLGLFDGSSPASSAVLVKYTYYGDANLDGTIDGSDYSRIDGAGSNAVGWYNGDFNYDGSIDGSDYTLIDNAYNQQGASLATQIAGSKVVAPPAASTSAVNSLFSSVPISAEQEKHRRSAVVEIGLSAE